MAHVPPGAQIDFDAAIPDAATRESAVEPAVVWEVNDPAGGEIDAAGQYTAPDQPGTFYVIATATHPAGPASAVAVVVVGDGGSDPSPLPTATPTPKPTPTPAPTPAPTATPAPAPTPASGKPLFGTLHTPNNRPISHWEADIRRHYGLDASQSIVDSAATSDLQAAFAARSGFGTPYAVFGEVAYVIYYAKAGDPEYPIADVSGGVKTCPLDPAGRGVRVPSGARRWNSSSAGPIAIEPASSGNTDIHFTIVDVERNRVYAFYSYGGQVIGISGGQFRSSARGCDVLHGDDAKILAAQSYSTRYGCTGGAGYPSSACGVAGVGAGVSAGGSFGSGDSNGFLGPHGVIMPQDFDDTGWSGEAVGTLHHALRCSAPAAYQYGYMWPMQNPMSGTPGRALRDGQIIRLDPAYDVAGSSASAAEKRVMRTLQVYGCVLSDYANYGMALFALGAWDGTGPNRGRNPWTSAGGANAEAQSFYTNVSAQGTRMNLAIPTSRLQVIRPHGASYPAR